MLELNTPIILPSGITLTSCICRYDYGSPRSEDKATLEIYYYKDNAAFLADLDPIQPDNIPLRKISTVISAVNYRNIDMQTVHIRLQGLLEQGDQHPQWNANWGVWPGLGIGTVIIVLPT